MNRWIQVDRMPGDQVGYCWHDLCLPRVDFRVNGDKIVNAVTGEEWTGGERGYIVPSSRAFEILSDIASGNGCLATAHRHFDPDEFQYMFFPAEFCRRLRPNERPQVREIA